MGKKSIFLTMVLVLALAVSCGKDYDAEFEAIEQRIEKLKAADAKTRQMILAEMDKLSAEIIKRIAQMEQNVHQYLAASMSKVKGAIDSESAKIHNKIEEGSKKLGTSITSYADRLNNLIETKSKEFEQSRAKLEKELKDAIADGDAALTRRIKNGVATLDKLQKDLPELCRKTQERLDALQDLEYKYAQISTEITNLDERKNAMMQMARDYQDALIDVIASDLDQYSSTKLEGYYLNVVDAYQLAEDTFNSLDMMNDEMESMYSDMPDLDSALGEAETLFSDLEDLESSLGGYSPEDEAADILDALQDALAKSSNVDYDLSGLDETVSTIGEIAHEKIAAIYSMLDVIAEKQEEFNILDNILEEGDF